MHFSQSKSTKCEIGCFAWSPWCRGKMKKTNLHREKAYAGGLQIMQHTCFWYADHDALNPRIFCDKYFLELMPFQCIFMGRSTYRVQHGVGVNNPSAIAAFVPSHFMALPEPHFLLCVPDKKWTTYVRDLQHIGIQHLPWRLANMHHQAGFNAYFAVKINKMWNFCLKLWFFRNHYHRDLKSAALDSACHKP